MGASCTKAGREEAAFLKAAKEGDCATVHETIFRHVDWAYKTQTWNGQSVFHLAARYGRVDVLETVVEAVRMNPAGPDQWKKLLRLGRSTDAIIKAMSNLRDSRCQTPLHTACIYGSAEVAVLLLKIGATPWAWDELGGRTPLHYAASMGHVDCIRALLAAAPPGPRTEAAGLRPPNSARTRLVDVCNDSGYTPLHYAVWAGNAAAIRALTSFDASLSTRNVAAGSDWIVSVIKCTPLHLAAHKGNAEVVKLLLSAHVQSQAHAAAALPNPNDRRRRDPRRHVNEARQLPYHVAAARGHSHLLEMLHPDVPYNFILSPAEMEATARLYGVPKLSVLAAKALQHKLISEIEAAVGAIKGEGGSTALEGGGGAGGGASLRARGRAESITAMSEAIAAAAGAAGGAGALSAGNSLYGAAGGGSAAAAAAAALSTAAARLRSAGGTLSAGNSLYGTAAAAVAAAAAGSRPPSQVSVRAIGVPGPAPAAAAAPAGSAAPGPEAAAEARGAKAGEGGGAVGGTSSNGSGGSSGVTVNGGGAVEPRPLPADPVARTRASVAPLPRAPSLPLPPAPISPFLAASGVGAPQGVPQPAGSRQPDYGEAASAFALFAAEPFAESRGDPLGAPSAAPTPAREERARESRRQSKNLRHADSANAQNARSFRAMLAGAMRPSRREAAAAGRSELGSTSVSVGPLQRMNTAAAEAAAEAAAAEAAGRAASDAASSLSSVSVTVGVLQRSHHAPHRGLPPPLADLDLDLDDLDGVLRALQPGEALSAYGGHGGRSGYGSGATTPSMRPRGSARRLDPGGGAATASAAAAAAAAAGFANEGAGPSPGRARGSEAASPSGRSRGRGLGGWFRSGKQANGTVEPAANGEPLGPLPPGGASMYGSAVLTPEGSNHIPAAAGVAPSPAPGGAAGAAAHGSRFRPSTDAPPLNSTSVASSFAPLNTAAHSTMPVDSSMYGLTPAAGSPAAGSRRTSCDVRPGGAEGAAGGGAAGTAADAPADSAFATAGAAAGSGASAAAAAGAVPEGASPGGRLGPLESGVQHMLANLAEAPHQVLRRYRLLQLTHGVDLEELLRDHSELAAAGATAPPGGGGGSGAATPRHRHGGGSLRLAMARTRSDSDDSGLPEPPQRTSWAGQGGGAVAVLGGGVAAAAGGLRGGRRSDDVAAAVRGARGGGVGSTSVTLALLEPPPPFPSAAPSPAPSTRGGGAAAATAAGGGISAVSAFVAAADTPLGAEEPDVEPAPPGVAPRAASQQALAGALLRQLSSRAVSEAGDAVCGVCFDAPERLCLAIQGCGHRLCAECSRELCTLNTFKPALCPFCRGYIGGFAFPAAKRR